LLVACLLLHYSFRVTIWYNCLVNLEVIIHCTSGRSSLKDSKPLCRDLGEVGRVARTGVRLRRGRGRPDVCSIHPTNVYTLLLMHSSTYAPFYYLCTLTERTVRAIDPRPFSMTFDMLIIEYHWLLRASSSGHGSVGTSRPPVHCRD
jgi:hypothetical protein